MSTGPVVNGGLSTPTPPTRASTPPGHDLRAIAAAFQLLAGASALSIVFGMGTNKIVAAVGGASGIAVVGIYRTLTSLLAGGISLGLTNMIVQQLSTAKSDEDARHHISAAWTLFLLQSGAIAAIAIFGAAPLATWLFGNDSYVWPLRTAIFLVIGVHAKQVVSDFLNGRALVKKVTIVNIATSFLTVATTYPLLLLGKLGLASVIGLTCFFGAALGSWYVYREYGLRRADLRPRLDGDRIRHLPVSGYGTARVVIVSGGLLAIQAMINRHYGTSSLGLYNAAATVEATSVTLLMASMRSYFLPQLGKLATQAEKNAFVDTVLRMLLALMIPGLAALVLGGKYVLLILFSSKFLEATELLVVMGLSIVAQAFVWCYMFFAVHKADYRLIMYVDGAWAAVYFALVLACIQTDASLRTITWCYTGSLFLQAAMYIVALARTFDRGIASMRTVALALSIAGWIVFGLYVALASPARQVLFALGSLAFSFALFVRLRTSRPIESA